MEHVMFLAAQTLVRFYGHLFGNRFVEAQTENTNNSESNVFKLGH